MKDLDNKTLCEKLKQHFGHEVCIARYRSAEGFEYVLECESCGEIVLDGELYTLAARTDAE